MPDITISVIVPLFNKEWFIRSTIMSILSQDGGFLEILVVDDGSTDAGPTIVLGINDPRIRYIRQPNSGVSAARNTGIEQAKGEYVAFLDADDLYLGKYLSTILKMIQLYPKAGLFATAYVKKDTVGNVFYPKRIGEVSGNGIVLLTDFYRYWSSSSFFWTSSVCIKRSVLMENDIRFPVGESLGEDQDVWFRLAESYPIVFCGQPLSVYNLGVPSSLTAGADITELLPVFLRLEKRIETPEFPRHLLKGARKAVSAHYLNVGRNKIAAKDWTGSAELIFCKQAMYKKWYWARCAASYIWGRFHTAVRGAVHVNN